MDIQDILVYIIVACCLLLAGTFSVPLSAEKEIQTDVDADVADATGVLHTKNRTTFFCKNIRL